MKKNKHYILILAVIALFYLTSCNNKGMQGNLKIKEENIKTKIDSSQPKGKITNTKVDTPKKSGTVNKLPWANDEEFKRLQKENGTTVLLAAYCTVLKDPLPGEEYNVHLAASSLAGMVVSPGEVFSQNNGIGPYVESKGYQKGPTYIGSKVSTTEGGGVCKVASTLYNVSILSDLEIVERHNHSMPVPYVPYGQDATVAYGAKDFKFKNNTEHPILIWAKGVGNRLYIGFYGKEEPPKVEWNHKTLESFKAPTEYIKNPELKEGEEKIIIEGMDGAIVESWLTIKNLDGTTKTKKLGTSSYRAMPHVVEVNK
ncbi:VanW family protein [Gottschalkia purinilytica]|uniref:VanW family protein n=1 Tax=Gottschalkia purinilytica TaxID=1503 RepID=A0A0L0W8E2_GOTPU|nr:VanW family protein [Gottschalkia purinilytica]KNF07717.1 VanW family protein [Gottschalkia purinilytica]